jgi:uncharacterized protein YqgV (UPF0045/DUF77 family)
LRIDERRDKEGSIKQKLESVAKINTLSIY